jgi:hypothetical protein
MKTALLLTFCISCITAHRPEPSSQHAFLGPEQAFMGHENFNEVASTDAFFGLGTFANLPYVNCLSPNTEGGRYDIAVLGAPFDTVSSLPFYFLLSKLQADWVKERNRQTRRPFRTRRNPQRFATHCSS